MVTRQEYKIHLRSGAGARAGAQWYRDGRDGRKEIHRHI